MKNIKFKFALPVFIVLVTFIGVGCQSTKSDSSVDSLRKEHQALSDQGTQARWETPTHLIQGEKQITFIGSKSGEGYFSPDGSKMIFQSERYDGNPFYQMYVMDLKSGKTQLVSPGHGKTTCGWIHPSLKKVMYSSTHLDADWKKKAADEIENRKKPVKGRYSWSYDENYEIFSSDLNGKNLKRLTNAKGYDAEGAYSPDGQWIVFASNRNGYTQNLSEEDRKYFEQDPSYMMDIFIMKEDGSGLRQLTNSKGYDGGPFFSADGKKITWRRFSANGSTAEIYTMNVDGSDQKQITHLKSMSWAPFFHPSGDYIIFGSSVLGYSNFELFIVDAEGKKDPVRVSFADGFDGLPVFTPDGHQLSWTHRSEKGDSQILMAAWDDVMARKLLDLPPWNPLDQKKTPQIAAADIKTWVGYLASAQMKGRRTGSDEEKLYTETLATQFKTWGLKPLKGDSFFHQFEYVSGVDLGVKNSLEAVGSLAKKWKVQEDYIPMSYTKVGAFSASPVVFAGYGIKAPATDKLPAYDSYRGLDVKGKWVLILNDIPQQVSTEMRHHLNTFSRLQHKVSSAKNEGALGVLVFSGPLSPWQESLSKLKFDGSLSESSLAVLRVSPSAAQELLIKAKKDVKIIQADLDKGLFIEGFDIPSVYLKSEIDLVSKKSVGRNVLAMLPASGARSSIMIGAHGDHLGFGEGGSSLAKVNERGMIHYGADDNASGVAGVMELAHYFASLKKQSPGVLKKNIIFAVWSGEETGILGSSALVADYAKITGKKLETDVEAYLNMDMIGRLRDKLLIQGVGSAKYWHQMIEETALQSALPVSLQEDPYLPTDSMAFYLGKVPAVTFFTGSHAEYHSPRDTFETLNYEGTEKVVQLVQKLTQVLADNSQQFLKYEKVGSGQKNLEGRSFRIFLGTIPDYSQEGVKGVRISGTSKESPAEMAGLIEKDIITEFDGRRIENLYDYVYALQSVKPNQTTKIKVLRAGKEKEFSITPKLKE